MLYVTAHMVEARQLGRRQGVNAYAYRSDGTVPAGTNLSAVIDEVASKPGRLLGCSIELPPGGNGVHAYVDLLLEDDGTVEGALQEVRRQLEDANTDSVTIRASAPQGILRCYVASRVNRLEALEKVERGVLAATSAARPQPLVIIRERMSKLAIYQLAPATRERLKRVHHADWHFAPLRVRDEDATALEATRDSILPHIAEVVTGLHRRAIEGMGGLTMKTKEGELLLEWPAADWMERKGS